MTRTTLMISTPTITVAMATPMETRARSVDSADPVAAGLVMATPEVPVVAGCHRDATIAAAVLVT